MHFIELELQNGDPIYVNADQIVSFAWAPHGAEVTLTTGKILVNEKRDWIFNKIRELN